MNKIVAFDLEIVKEIPDGVEWRDIRPLGISCMSFLPSDQILSSLKFHSDSMDSPISGAMSSEELAPTISWMLDLVDDGYRLVTWNGLGFDFDVLAEESGMYEECKQLALSHVDMMFHFFCLKGFPVGLDAVARGLGFGGKMAGMTGALAPALWASPNLSDRLKVLRYVHQDAVSTLEIYERTAEMKKVNWITQKGKLSTCWLMDGWKTVKECLEIPLPDTSWMDNPMKREDFYSWIK
jgi:hypothetical protein